jgi:hypothetical protein
MSRRKNSKQCQPRSIANRGMAASGWTWCLTKAADLKGNCRSPARGCQLWAWLRIGEYGLSMGPRGDTNVGKHSRKRKDMQKLMLFPLVGFQAVAGAAAGVKTAPRERESSPGTRELLPGDWSTAAKAARGRGPRWNRDVEDKPHGELHLRAHTGLSGERAEIARAKGAAKESTGCRGSCLACGSE